MADKEIELPIIGMHCAGCASAVERKLSKDLPGVLACSVSLATQSAAVRYDPGLTDLESMAGAVEAAGYRAVLPEAELESADAGQIAREHEFTDRWNRLMAGLGFTMPLGGGRQGQEIDLARAG